MKRLEMLAMQINPIANNNQDDVVICSAVRTPLTKSKRGAFRNTAPEIMLAAALDEAVKRAKVQKKHIEDCVIGNVLQPGAGSYSSRMAQYLVGFPDSTTTLGVNRLCSSGLQACATIAAKIKGGQINIGIGGGVETMSLFSMQGSVNPELISEAVFENESARNCLMPMGTTSQNVVQKFGITRQKQDQMAFQSHQKAYNAQKNGLYKGNLVLLEQIIPVKTQTKGKDGKMVDVLVTEDDGIRKETTMEGLAKLKPAFKTNGSTTAGNSSQTTDGAAAVVLAKRSVAKKLGMPILAKFTGYAVAGVPPQVMGIGPAFAIPKLLQNLKMRLQDIDIFEINEAFASQATYCIQKLGIDRKKLNPKGGAIALGHPLGCTGARQIATLLPQLRRTNGKRGIVSMCIGTGMGAAALIQLQ